MTNLGFHSVMIHDKKVVVVLPAFNAAKTLKKTVMAIPQDTVDEIILVDDASDDSTLAVAKSMGLKIISHSENLGYGANQKTCFAEALKLNADVVILLHPDYQYTPLLIPAMASMIAIGQYDIVLGSRILGRGAVSGGMPIYKYIANRLLTFFENLLLNRKYSEYHTGYRAYSGKALRLLPYQINSDDFIFDNQIITQAVYNDLEIGEISCPARYDDDSSSINFIRSLKYGLGVLINSLAYRLHVLGIIQSALYPQENGSAERRDKIR
jgi:glycosyltransferase involved in cell wall biosynthesis